MSSAKNGQAEGVASQVMGVLGWAAGRHVPPPLPCGGQGVVPLPASSRRPSSTQNPQTAGKTQNKEATNPIGKLQGDAGSFCSGTGAEPPVRAVLR